MKSGKLVVSLLAVVACATLVYANLLTNPGFEVGAAAGATPDGYWDYQDGGQESWAGQTGTNGYAFYGWVDGSYAGVGQDVSVVGAGSSIFTFTIQGLAEANYNSTGSETWMIMEFWSNLTDSAYSYRVTNDIYSAVVGDPDNWNTYTFGHTNYDATILGVKVMVGAGGFQDTGGNQSLKLDNWDFTQVVPEPVTATMVVLGFGALYAVRRRRRG